ncbi:MAG: phospholipase [Tannerella sp.]|jgi:hypothetical protein|nr:phospholipase [Tannerella sp.]
MWYLVCSLIILGLICACIKLFDHRKQQGRAEWGETRSSQEERPIPKECCGQHEVCERDSLLAALSKKVEYYEDEELDAYRGVASEAYPEVAIDEFREVLYTMREDEVAGWVRSLQLREVNLPDVLRDEVFMIVGEQRI